MTPDERKAHPSYPELLAADGHNLLGRLAQLEQRSVEQHNTQCRQADAIATLEQQVRDLTADLARHEATPRAHTRYEFSTLGEVVLCGLETALDYDPRDQMDVPITDDAQTDGPMLVDSELTADQRNRIWQRVQAAANGGA